MSIGKGGNNMCLSVGVVVLWCSEVSTKCHWSLQTVNVITCILYKVIDMEMVQLMQWNTIDYIQQFHILERTYNTRETGSYACMNTKNGQPWPGKDNVTKCKWSAVKAHMCVCRISMMNGIACPTRTNLYTTPYKYNFVQPGLQILPKILCIEKAWFTLNGITAQATFTLGKGKAIAVQAWTGPEGSRPFRLPDFMKTSTWRW